jgi:hypothetical protein
VATTTTTTTTTTNHDRVSSEMCFMRWTVSLSEHKINEEVVTVTNSSSNSLYNAIYRVGKNTSKE